jgi:thiol-disulfide isomerase/thioredoxin
MRMRSIPRGSRPAARSGDPAPDWKPTDPKGRTHTLSEYRGKVVVLDFRATWCGPCASLMPRMEKLQRKYGGESLPVVYVIGADGTVVYSHAGAEHGNLSSLIEKQLASQRH